MDKFRNFVDQHTFDKWNRQVWEFKENYWQIVNRVPDSNLIPTISKHP